jgi:hypothetical protein
LKQLNLDKSALQASLEEARSREGLGGAAAGAGGDAAAAAALAKYNKLKERYKVSFMSLDEE